MRRLQLAMLALWFGIVANDQHVHAAEICGNGIDDDGDNVSDEGCNPEGYLQVRESPLPRSAIGIVAPISGQQIWNEPPDLHVDVAYGPDLELTRSYNSQVRQGGPLGDGWRHNFMSWITFDDPAIGNYVTVRMPTGDDVGFTWFNTTAGIASYRPSAGHKSAGSLSVYNGIWTLRTATGWTYTYSGSGSVRYLDAIANPRGYALTITRSGADIDRVTAATGAKELRFGYTLGFPYGRRLTSVEYWADGTRRAVLAFPYGDVPDRATLAGVTFRQYEYEAHGRLARVSDGSGHTIAQFDYASTSPGKTVRVKSRQGFVGYKYGDATCSGGDGVYQYFNLKDSTTGEGTACDTDAQCGAGHFCGGQTTPGTGTSGLCFRARRCVTTTSAADDLVGAVSSSCPTCTDAADRVWDTTNLTLTGRKDASNIWTSYLYNSSGFMTKMVENDTDANAGTVPPGARVTWFFYDATFKGLVSEVRRRSELKPAGACDDVATTDCKRTLYTYTVGAELDTVTEIGFTYNLNGAVVAYSYVTDNDYDAQGRLTQVNGPRTDTPYDLIQYTYWSGAGNLQDGYLRTVTRLKTATAALATTYDGYDHWGNAGRVVDPGSKLTCRTYDANRNVLVTTRVAMAGQTACTADPSDLVTTNTYDSGLHLVQVQHPEGNCTHYEYDARGRLQRVKRRDNCAPAQAGDTEELTYDDNGNLALIEYKDASGAVTYRQEKTFGPDGRIVEVLDPVDTANKTTLAYTTDGDLASVTGAASVGKTEWAYDKLRRLDAEKRFNSAGAFDTWDLTPGVQLDRPTKVQDDDGKSIQWVWDDLGRKVKQVTPDAGTTIVTYDEAGNPTDRVDGKGTADEVVHHFAYDPLGRLRGENWGDPACFTQGGNEVQHTYDDPGGCPAGTCVGSMGRLAWVRTKIRCDDAQSDDTFDQWTYYGYDDAGRVVKEAIRDDGGRVADQLYAWDRNGNRTSTTGPSGFYQKNVYGSAANNSDRDKVVEVRRGSGGNDTVIVDAGKWSPFGALAEYRQANTIAGNRIMVRLRRDLAQRPIEVLYEQEVTGTDLFRIAYTRDAQGRIAVRDFTGGHAALQDAYYTYDWQDRITCDAAVAGACPTSGANVKTNLSSSPPYTASSDRRSIKHRNTATWPLDTFTYTLAPGKEHIASIAKGNGQVIGFGWDGRGNRLYDDDAQFADDRRDYVYDARDNLVSVSGKMKISDTEIHSYTQTNAFDHKNRRVFKSVLDTSATPNVESQTFYYYDLDDHLIEVRYTPNIADSTTYQIWQLYWIEDRPIAIVQTTYPSAAVLKRFIHADELGTPLEMYSWPASGDAARSWAYNPDAFGWGQVIANATAYQPLRFPGQVSDDETTAVYFDTATSTYKPLRPALHDNRYRVYDPFVGAFLQADPEMARSWQAYSYASNNPVTRADRDGRLDSDEGRAGNACTMQQIEGGYSDVDGDCILTCWNCSGTVGGGSDWPGDCTGPYCPVGEPEPCLIYGLCGDEGPQPPEPEPDDCPEVIEECRKGCGGWRDCIKACAKREGCTLPFQLPPWTRWSPAQRADDIGTTITRTL